MPSPLIRLLTRDPFVERALAEAAVSMKCSLSTSASAEELAQRLREGRNGVALVVLDLDPLLGDLAPLDAVIGCFQRYPVVTLLGANEGGATMFSMPECSTACLSKPISAAGFAQMIARYCPGRGESGLGSALAEPAMR